MHGDEMNDLHEERGLEVMITFPFGPGVLYSYRSVKDYTRYLYLNILILIMITLSLTLPCTPCGTPTLAYLKACSYVLLALRRS